MKKSISFISACAVAILFVAASSQPAAAQGFNIGGIKVQTGNQTDKNKKDNDQDNNNSNTSNRRSKSGNKSNNSGNIEIPEGFQQFIPGQNNQGGGQGGQNNSNQSRRSGQQGNFPNNQQFQNWQQSSKNSFNIGTWNGGKWQGTHDAKKWTQAFGGNGQQPFSSQWYKDHPKAWKYSGSKNSNSNIWVGGTLPGLYTWLGWGNVPQQYRVYYGNNVPQQFNHQHYGEWYPLGVYSLMAGPGDPGTRIVQLAVDQRGHLAGNYYDMISNSNYSLSGNIRQQSQRASFALNKNQFVRFRAPIYELLQPYGSLTVSLPGGEQEWQFVRLEN